MGFTIHDSHVRVDRFKATGKWYDTMEVNMDAYYDHWSIHEALCMAIEHDFGEGYIDAWTEQGGSFVCIEPFHKYSHPLMLK